MSHFRINARVFFQSKQRVVLYINIVTAYSPLLTITVASTAEVNAKASALTDLLYVTVVKVVESCPSVVVQRKNTALAGTAACFGMMQVSAVAVAL